MTAEFGKVAQKGFLFILKIDIFQSQCTKKMRLVAENDLYLVNLAFLILFKYLVVFTVAIWQRAKLGHTNEGNWKLILVTFGISHPLQRAAKIMI